LNPVFSKKNISASTIRYRRAEVSAKVLLSMVLSISLSSFTPHNTPSHLQDISHTFIDFSFILYEHLERGEALV
jgi:hypothetical protein